MMTKFKEAEIMRLEKIQSEFWDYQATVSEEGIIAKIMRGIEKGPSIKIQLLTDDEHDTLNTYESIGFFKSAVYQRVAIAIPMGPLLARTAKGTRVIAGHLSRAGEKK